MENMVDEKRKKEKVPGLGVLKILGSIQLFP
jgi:hypothetical protein